MTTAFENPPVAHRRLRAVRASAALLLAIGAVAVSTQPSQALVGGAYSGALTASAATVRMGETITVTESAVSLADVQTPGITVGIRRLGFTVVSSHRPRTGLCRIAGSATCSFLLLAPHETQTYTLTLTPTAVGTFVLTGWTDQPVAGGSGGTVQSVTVTVTG